MASAQWCQSYLGLNVLIRAQLKIHFPSRFSSQAHIALFRKDI